MTHDLVVIGASDPDGMKRHTDECRTGGYPFVAVGRTAPRLRGPYAVAVAELVGERGRGERVVRAAGPEVAQPLDHGGRPDLVLARL